MIKLLMFLSVLISVSQASSRCKVNDFLDLTIYGVNSVSITNFQIHGTVASGNILTLKNAKIESPGCRAVISGGAGYLSGSHITGSVEINGKARLESTEIKGDLRSPYQVELLDSKFGALYGPKRPLGSRFSYTQFLKGLPARSIEPEYLEGNLLQVSFENELGTERSKNLRIIPYKKFLTLSLHDKKSYFNIHSRELQKIEAIEFRGKSDQIIVINVRGASFKNPGLVLDFSSDIQAKNIIWNFPEASTVDLSDNNPSSDGWAGIVWVPNGSVIAGRFRGSISAYNVNLQ